MNWESLYMKEKARICILFIIRTYKKQPLVWNMEIFYKQIYLSSYGIHVKTW